MDFWASYKCLTNVLQMSYKGLKGVLQIPDRFLLQNRPEIGIIDRNPFDRIFSTGMKLCALLTGRGHKFIPGGHLLTGSGLKEVTNSNHELPNEWAQVDTQVDKVR